jgi:1,4-dihydroxy-2-naphthoate octaprenyltransferase
LSEVVHSAAIWGSLPIAFLVATILHANNLRDLDADAAEHKRTLAVIFGRRFARFEYIALTSGAFISTLLLVLSGVAPVFTLAVGVFAWEGWKLIQVATHSVDPAELHMVLLRTAHLHKWFGGVYVGAWLLAVLI